MIACQLSASHDPLESLGGNFPNGPDNVFGKGAHAFPDGFPVFRCIKFHAHQGAAYAFPGVAILEGRLFASFNRINEELLFTAGHVIAATVIWLVCDLRKLDVLTLGRSTAITLGVNYKWVVLRSLMIVSILASASTVLVGPVTFLGILIVSIARFIFPTYRHIVLMPGTALVGVAALTFGMLLTERWLNFSVPLSVIINFVGGVYFIYLIMKIKRI